MRCAFQHQSRSCQALAVAVATSPSAVVLAAPEAAGVQRRRRRLQNALVPLLFPSTVTALRLLFPQIRDANSVIAFTGAGISTSCGIPDFR